MIVHGLVPRPSEGGGESPRDEARLSSDTALCDYIIAMFVYCMCVWEQLMHYHAKRMQ